MNAGGESCVVQGKPFFQLFESSVWVPGDCVSDCHVCHVRGAILRHDGHDSCVASRIRAPRAGNQLTCNQLASKLDFPDAASSDTFEPYRDTRWRTFVAVFPRADCFGLRNSYENYKMECSWMPPTFRPLIRQCAPERGKSPCEIMHLDAVWLGVGRGIGTGIRRCVHGLIGWHGIAVS